MDRKRQRSPAPGLPGFSGDGDPATAAELNAPSGVTLDQAGNIYIADTQNHRIRMIAPDGIITTIAGTGTCGFSGDGGPALSAQLCQPAQMLFDSSGDLLIADYGNRRVRKMTLGGTIATIAGDGDDRPEPVLSPDRAAMADRRSTRHLHCWAESHLTPLGIYM